MSHKDELVIEWKGHFKAKGPSTYVVVGLCVGALASLVGFNLPQVGLIAYPITAIAVLTLFMPIIRAAEAKLLSTVGTGKARPAG